MPLLSRIRDFANDTITKIYNYVGAKMAIAVLNKSTLVSDNEVDLMCQAIQKQMDFHVAPAWEQKPAIIKFYKNKILVPKGSYIITVTDKSSDVEDEGDFGYHSIDNGDVYGYVFVKPILDDGGEVLYDEQNDQNISVCSVLSHEIIETWGDRFANFWADGPEIDAGSEYALELCDPVEADSYVIEINDIKMSVSNFVYPSWFNPQAKSPKDLPFDYMSKLTAPFTMTSGGYMIVRKTLEINQVYGKNTLERKKPEKKNKSYPKIARRP